uniref:Uncharacterized protein n=1 Tax=Lygus hesperus TaxID=30085 RepID=A0A146L056_LYGHE
MRSQLQTPVVRQAASGDGIACGCCACCTCLHLSFLQTTPGILKIVQMETLFNASAALSYLSSSAYLAAAVNLYLYPLYLVTLGFIAYPAMIAAYTMGFALAALHALDAYYCYRHFRGYR